MNAAGRTKSLQPLLENTETVIFLHPLPFGGIKEESGRVSALAVTALAIVVPAAR